MRVLHVEDGIVLGLLLHRLAKSKSSGASALRKSIMKRTEPAPTSSTTSRSVTRSPERFDMTTGSPARKSLTSWQKRMSSAASPSLIAVTAAFMRFG